MYSVAVRRDFVAQHFLIGGDWGPENDWHSHHYVVELRLEGPELNEHGYLTDIVDVEACLEEIAAGYRDKTLNKLPAFAGLNPSIEHLARTISDEICARLDTTVLAAVTVTIWENDIAWASFRRTLA